jgi:hypothetical protein
MRNRLNNVLQLITPRNDLLLRRLTLAGVIIERTDELDRKGEALTGIRAGSKSL